MLKTNRRTFLKATAVAGASTLVVSDLLAQESPNEKVQFGCVGIGGKGASDSNDANRFGVVVAYTDTNRNQLKGGKQRFKEAGDNAFEDYREMFDKMGDKIDAITVSTAEKQTVNSAVLPTNSRSSTNHATISIGMLIARLR